MTSGPWLEVAPITLSDVSIIPESADAGGKGPSIALWAVSDKGDVLCRLGVSELNPAVSTDPLAFWDCPWFCRIFRTSESSLRGRWPQVSPDLPRMGLWGDRTSYVIRMRQVVPRPRLAWKAAISLSPGAVGWHGGDLAPLMK